MSSRVLGFIEGRHGSSQGAPLKGEFDNKAAVQSHLDRLGIDRSVTGVTKGSLVVENEDRPSSRQALAAHSKVPTPPYLPQTNLPDKRTALRQSKVPFKDKLATRGTCKDGERATTKSREVLVSNDPWGTDTEHLDDTSELISLGNPGDVPVKSEAASEFKVPLQNYSTQMRTSQTPQKPRDPYFSNATASSDREPYAQPNSDPDGVDEYDNASQYMDSPSQDAYGPGDYSLERADVLAHGKRAINDKPYRQQQETSWHGLDQASYPPNVAPKILAAPISDYPRQDSPATRSIGNASTDNDELESEDGDTGLREIDDRSIMFRPVANSSANDAELRVTESRKVKRKHSPGVVFQKPDDGLELPFGNLPVARRNHKHAQITVHQSLDYDVKTLSSMSYQDLAQEPFDTGPSPTELGDPTLRDESTLKEKLLHLHSLEKPREQLQSLRQGFFSSLPIEQYEECGDLMAEQFSQIILKFKQARQQKRSIAKEFEDEVTVRQEAVEKRKMAVTKDLARLKRAGQDVVQGR
ncbi:MAG: hypothetical protein LQ346_005237 [Caloplaca aetnensis]|nr:MAG: hypothetical protein LQ346_005237 [Caloplaca aetnensis]